MKPSRMTVPIAALRRLICSHITFLLDEFDPIKDVRKQTGRGNNTSTRAHYLFPLLFIVGTLTQAILGLETITSLDEISVRFDHVITHKIFPVSLGLQIDFLGSAVVGLWTLELFNLLLTEPLKKQFFMWLTNNRKNRTHQLLYNHEPIERPAREAILKVHSTIRRLVPRCLVVWCLIIQLYLIQQMIVLRYFTPNPQTFLFWGFTFPGFLFYIIFFVMMYPVYFIATTKYIQIEQKFLLSDLVRLNDAFKQHHSTKATLTGHFKRFLTLNSITRRLCQKTAGYDHFWSRYLTIFFLLEMTITCYSVYILFILRVPFMHKIIFIAVLTYPISQLTLLIRQCADVETANQMIDAQNGRFQRQLQLIPLGKRLTTVSTTLKVESIASNRVASQYGFKLMNDYIVKSETLFLTFYNMSLFFMLNFSIGPAN